MILNYVCGKYMGKKNMKNELFRVLRFEQCVNNEDYSCV